jgi:LacI family transcriptional regulator
MAEYETASRLAAEHLLALGHTRIAAIEGPPDVTSGRAHHAGLTAALGAAGLALDPALVRRGPFEWSFGRLAAESLLEVPDPPTALLVSNHEASFGVLPVLADSGLRVPEDLSVICTEEEPYYAWWSPALSTVDNRAQEQACRAAGLLLAQLTGAGEPVGRAELVAPRLVLRESTAAPRGRVRQVS